MEFNIGLIRVLTTDDEAILNAHGRKIEKYFPNLKIESKCIPNQFDGIHSKETMAIAVPKIIELAKEFRDKDAIIVSCADDPAIEELNQIANMPIIVGAGTALSILSAVTGEKVGVIGVSDEIPKPLRKRLRSRVFNLGLPDKVNSTLDLMTAEGIESCVKKGEKLKAAGAELIALACTGFATVDFAQKLERHLGISVLDPVICEGFIAYYELIRRQ